VPTIISHSLAAVVLGTCYPERKLPVRFWVLAALCATLPDADVFGFALGFRYDDMLGHRGLTHSLLFALILGFLIVILFFSRVKKLTKAWWMLVAFFFIATASHGFLDALTDGGRGVAFFAPFHNERYFFPWRPIEVSPLGLGRFLSSRGLEVMLSEFVWIWIPCALLALAAYCFRKRLRSKNT